MKRSSFATALCVGLAWAMLGSGPCGVFPGGALQGELVTEAVEDWRFIGESSACAIEVRPEHPHSVRANCMQREGRLYVGSILAPRKRWPAMVAEDSRVRVRIAGKVYEGRAVRITDPAERIRVLGGTPEDPPSQSHWLWRLDPR